jgi:hypothetical protein
VFPSPECIDYLTDPNTVLGISRILMSDIKILPSVTCILIRKAKNKNIFFFFFEAKPHYISLGLP